MKFGVREICEVVLKAKAAQKVGNKVFYAGEPVCYFDTLKTSSMEGAATTVYAQGGRGNSRLVAWEGERTVTFTMEDALISPEGFMILSGAGLIDSAEKPIYQHMTETIDRMDILEGDTLQIPLTNMPYLPADKGQNYAYVMLMKNGEIVSEPYIPTHIPAVDGGYEIKPSEEAKFAGKYVITVPTADGANYNELGINYNSELGVYENEEAHSYELKGEFPAFDAVLVDYYVERKGENVAQQIEITPDKFGGNYYLEASTLFRDTNGVDMPAEFIIPNCKIQSNFTFTMASTGDPSTFTFTMDAFPDYLKFDRSKKVLAAIQIIKGAGAQNIHRHSTAHEVAHDALEW